MLGAVLVYAAFVASPIGLDQLRGDVLAALGYVVNWHFLASGQSYFSGFTTPSPVLHLWSLAVEEQFYLLWPPIVLGVLMLARRRLTRTATIATVGVVAVVGALASAITMAVLYRPGGDPSRVYYGTDTRAQAMLIGAALAVFVELHGPLRSRIGRLVLSFARQRSVFRDRCRPVVRIQRDVDPQPLLRTLRTARVLGGHRGRDLAPRPARGGRARARPRVDPDAHDRKLLVRDATWLLAQSTFVLTPQRVGLDGLALLSTRLTVVVALAWATHQIIEEPIRRGVRLHSPTVARAAALIAVVALSTGRVRSHRGRAARVARRRRSGR